MRNRTLLRLAAQLLGAIVFVTGFAGGLFAQVQITTTSLPGGVVGDVYPSQNFSATGGTAPYTWNLASGTLPTGLMLDSTGFLHGTPTVAGTYPFMVQVTDSTTPTPQTATASFSIVVTAAMTITTTSPLPSGMVGVSYSQTFTSTGIQPVTWTQPAGILPPGLTLASNGFLTGIPTTIGTYDFTIQASDSSVPAQTDSETFEMVVNNSPLSITPTNPVNGAANPGNIYSYQVMATGGTLPYTNWLITAGALPPGFTLGPTSGNISGTTTTPGIFNFGVSVTDSSTPPVTATRNLMITIQPLLAITTPSLPSATVGLFYSQQLATPSTAPTPINWSVSSGFLAPGLQLTQNGAVVGTPTAAGTFNFTIQATAGNPTQVATQAYQLVISPASVPAIITSTLPNGTNGIAYAPSALTATGGTAPYVWSIVGGSLPGGLSLATDGTISGTPTSSGIFNFTVGITDSSVPALTASRALTITIQSGVTITTGPTLPVGEVGAFYAQPFAATGPTPLNWSLLSGLVPPGLSVASTGALTGTPAFAGTYNFTVQAGGGNPVQTNSQTFQIVINAGLTITSGVTLPSAAVSPYSYALTATGGTTPYTWTILQGTTPPGLTLSSAGVLSGTPTSLGSYTFTAQVADSFTPPQLTNRTFTIVVSQLAVTTLTLPDGMLNLPYSQQLQSSGTGVLTWTVTGGTLPAGLALSTTGVLAGTPTALGASSFTVTVTNPTNATSSQTYNFSVDPAVATLSTSLPATLNPTQSAPIALSLASPHPSDITGELVLTFTSKAEVQGDDPMTEFSTGSRSVNFTIPANTTSAVFASNVTLLVGTVSGTVTLTANIDNGPQGLAVSSVAIPATAPKITSVTATRTAGGVQVQISGYASARRVTSAEFDFQLTSGPAPALTQDVSSDFASWYVNTASVVFGSGFSYVQSFTVTGDVTQIQAVTVILTNAQGSTSSASIPIP